VWQQPGVTTVIPGARNVDQARANAAAGLAEDLPDELLDGVGRIYATHLAAALQSRW
jgi:aryl-alcohol dehydrogenase-like predicted oxidoreductase